MAIFRPGQGIVKISGTLGQQVFRSRRVGGVIARRSSVRAKLRSDQAAHSQNMQEVIELWRSLTPAQRQSWVDLNAALDPTEEGQAPNVQTAFNRFFGFNMANRAIGEADLLLAGTPTRSEISPPLYYTFVDAPGEDLQLAQFVEIQDPIAPDQIDVFRVSSPIPQPGRNGARSLRHWTRFDFPSSFPFPLDTLVEAPPPVPIPAGHDWVVEAYRLDPAGVVSRRSTWPTRGPIEGQVLGMRFETFGFLTAGSFHELTPAGIWTTHENDPISPVTTTIDLSTVSPPTLAGLRTALSAAFFYIEIAIPAGRETININRVQAFNRRPAGALFRPLVQYV